VGGDVRGSVPPLCEEGELGTSRNAEIAHTGTKIVFRGRRLGEMSQIAIGRGPDGRRQGVLRVGRQVRRISPGKTPGEKSRAGSSYGDRFASGGEVGGVAGMCGGETSTKKNAPVMGEEALQGGEKGQPCLFVGIEQNPQKRTGYSGGKASE